MDAGGSLPNRDILRRNVGNINNQLDKGFMKDRINRQSEAFKEALEYCKIFGLNWRTNIQPKIEAKEITGYYVLDETFSTTVKTIHL